MHIVHLVVGERRRRDPAAPSAEGLPLTVETCPHYLCLAAEEIPDGATQFKCAPPIRERENREALWRGAGRGRDRLRRHRSLPVHAGAEAAERGDFMAAWGGIASLQLGLAAVWTEAARRGARFDSWPAG